MDSKIFVVIFGIGVLCALALAKVLLIKEEKDKNV